MNYTVFIGWFFGGLALRCEPTHQSSMGTEHGSGSAAAVLPSLDLRKVTIHNDSGSTA